MTTYRVLLAAHLPADPAEATLVLAAVAAWHGLQANGAPMPEAAAPTAPTLRQIAEELGLHVGAARRGVRHLAAAGVVHVDGGVHVTADALRSRWEQRSAVIRLTADVRELGLRSEPLMVAGLVAGQVDQRLGRLVAGLGRLTGRTGLPRRTLQRAIAAADAAGAIHRWCIPGTGQLCLAPGPHPRREQAHEKRREEAHESSRAPQARREAAHPPSRSGAPPRREAAHPPSRSGAHQPGLSPDPASALPEGAIARQQPAAAEPDTAKREPDAEIQLQRAIMRTGLRSKLRPFDRLRFALDLARALHRAGMTAADLERMWALAKANPGVRDPDAMLATWLAGDWRVELAAADERERHNAARARGADAARTGEDLDADPTTAGDVAAQLLGQVNTA